MSGTGAKWRERYLALRQKRREAAAAAKAARDLAAPLPPPKQQRPRRGHLFHKRKHLKIYWPDWISRA
jgi:hypothetical protein